MKIAIDLDGVVFDTENLFRVYSEIYDVDYYKKDSVIDNTKRLYEDRYSWDKKDAFNFYKRINRKVLEECNVMPGCSLVLDKLKRDYEIIVVTSRRNDEIKYAIDYFESINLDIKIFNNEKDKLDRLLKEKVDIIIDDDYDICKNVSENNIKVLYFKNNASKEMKENEYIKTVYNWGEIYKYFYLKK